MKILKKVPALEVKRAFVIADYISHQKYLRTHMGIVTPAEYRKRLNKAKAIVSELPEAMLDMILKGEWRRRYIAYNKTNWYTATADVRELGVWKGAGGLPKRWTQGNLKETADYVSDALKKNPKQLKYRSYTAIPGIIKTALPVIQKEKYLLPIAFKGGTGTMGRRGLKHKTRAEIDDGCMRAIALTVSGKNKIKLYFGVPKRK